MDKPIEDASGQWLNPGDVITHANRSGSNIWLDVGYITEVNKSEGSIKWLRVEREWQSGYGKPRRFANKPTTLYRTDLCTKTGMTIERMKSKYGIQEQEVQLERPETEPLGSRFRNQTYGTIVEEQEVRGSNTHSPALDEEVPD